MGVLKFLIYIKNHYERIQRLSTIDQDK